MNKGLLGVLAAGAGASYYYSGNQASQDSGLISAAEMEFFKFIASHGKTYGTKAEYNFRLGVFAEKLAFIEEHNSRNDATSTVGLNFFADWTQEEMKSMLGYKQELKTENNVKVFDESDLPANVNWVDLGGVTPVKDQG